MLILHNYTHGIDYLVLHVLKALSFCVVMELSNSVETLIHVVFFLFEKVFLQPSDS